MNDLEKKNKLICPLCGLRKVILYNKPFRSAPHFVPCCLTCYRNHFDYDNNSVFNQHVFNQHLIHNFGGFNV